MMNNMSTSGFKGWQRAMLTVGVAAILQANGTGDPVYTLLPDGYTVHGSQVTGSGADATTAYFYDPSAASYTVVIKEGATLGNTTGIENSNELEFNSGKVTNHGTLTGSESGVSVAGDIIVINSGSITGTDRAAVYSSFNTSDVTAPTNNFKLVNSGSLFSTAGDGFDAFSSNNDTLGTGLNANVITVNNSGAITVGDSGLDFDNDNDGGGGAALNSLVVKNSGSITATYAIEVDDFFNEDNASNSTNTFEIKNSGALNSSSEIYLAGENETSKNGINTLSLTNSGTITSSGSEGVDISLENNSNSGNGTNTINIVNTGTITSDESGVDFSAINESNGGNALTTISIKNTGTITSAASYGLLDNDDDYNYENAGNAKISVNILNTGTISGSTGGIYLEPYNEEDGGNGISKVYVNNTGTIVVSDSEAYENGDGGNYYEAGNGTNKAVFLNSGSITGADNSVESFIYNGDNIGKATTTGYLLNSGSITATSGEGAYFFYENYDNGGNGVNNVADINTSTGNILAVTAAVDLEAENVNNFGTGLDKNSVIFSNVGTVTSTDGIGAYLYAENYADGGDSQNSIKISNSGTISSHSEGIFAEVTSVDAPGNATGSITLLNSGLIIDSSDTGVDLENDDSGTVGTGKGTIHVNNTSSGVIVGASEGLFIFNNVASPTYTASVTNAGVIVGGNTGIELDTNNGSVTSVGGVIGGGTNAILLDGTDSTVTIKGRTDIGGVIQGSGNEGNVLNFDLVGVSPAQRTAAKLAIAAADGGAGSFLAAGNTYNFDGFSTINFHASSFAQSVDSGLQDLASKIDANPLPIAFDAVYAQGFGGSEAALNGLSGREFLNEFRQVGLSNATAMSELADNRAFQLRSGTAGLDVSGLNINPASMIASLGDTQSVLGRIGSSALGGTNMSDSKDEKTMTSSPELPRWGAWASGTVTFADESDATDNPGYHSTSGSPTVGADYRLCPNLVVGALFNYTTGDVGFDDGSNLNTDSELGALYASWNHGPWYVDGLAGYGHTSYDQTRRALDGTHADASPDGDEVLASINGGYDFKLSGWTVSPEVGLQYTRLTKDSYNEGGAGAFDLNVGDEDVNSLRTKLGFHATRAFTFEGLKLTPQVNAAWYHECLDETNDVGNSLSGAPDLGSFIVETTEQGRDFALVGAGLMATPRQWHDSVSLFINYDAQVGQSDFVAHTVDGGVRVSF